MNQSFILVFIFSGFLLGCSKSKNDTPQFEEAPLQIGTPEVAECDPVKTPSIDCTCVTALIESNWSDYEEADAATIISGTDENMSQQSIDVLIDVAMQSDLQCTDSR